MAVDDGARIYLAPMFGDVLQIDLSGPSPIPARLSGSLDDHRDIAWVELVVHDLRGRRVATLLEGLREAGEHSLLWNGTDDAGVQVASGVYFARLETHVGTRVRKLVLAR